MDTVINQTAFSNDAMRGLAIETSSQDGSVALVDGLEVLPEERFPHGLKHAAGLLPLIDLLTEQHGWKPNQLTHLFVSQGPGSFTGLRIGITLAKTLAMVTAAKIIPVPTLRVLAMNAPASARHVIAILNAKRDQIFTSRFEKLDDQWIEREPAHVDSLISLIARSPRPVHLIGQGIPYHEKFLPADTTGIEITPVTTWRPRAEIVARLGLELARQNQFIDAETFVPIYLRKSEAEEKYDLQENSLR